MSQATHNLGPGSPSLSEKRPNIDDFGVRSNGPRWSLHLSAGRHPKSRQDVSIWISLNGETVVPDVPCIVGRPHLLESRASCALHRGPPHIVVRRAKAIFDHIHRFCRVCYWPGPVDMDNCSGPRGPKRYPYPPARTGNKSGRAGGYGQLSSLSKDCWCSIVPCQFVSIDS